MTTLSERLRILSSGMPDHVWKIMHEAADELERLENDDHDEHDDA